MSKKNKNRPKQEERPNAADVIAAYDELDQLREEHPEIAAEVNPTYDKKTIKEQLLGFYLSMMEWFHIETQVNRKTYLRLHLLGIFGVHHFYSRHWIKGLIYLAICWCSTQSTPKNQSKVNIPKERDTKSHLANHVPFHFRRHTPISDSSRQRILG